MQVILAFLIKPVAIRAGLIAIYVLRNANRILEMVATIQVKENAALNNLIAHRYMQQAHIRLHRYHFKCRVEIKMQDKSILLKHLEQITQWLMHQSVVFHVTRCFMDRPVVKHFQRNKLNLILATIYGSTQTNLLNPSLMMSAFNVALIPSVLYRQ